MKIKTKKPVAVAKDEDGPMRHVALELIVTNPKLPNRALKPDHVASLKKSIRSKGLDMPLGTWDGGDPTNMVKIEGVDGEHPATFLVHGAHRRAALQELKQEEPKWFSKQFPEGIPVTVRSGSLQEAILAQLRENVHRDNPEPSEVLPMIKRLSTKFKMKNSEIARQIGKSKSYVGSVLDIERELGAKFSKKVEKGGVGLRDAIEASQEVKRSRKKGKKVDIGKIVAKAESKGKKKKGRKRAPKRQTAKTLYQNYHAMPTMSSAKKLVIAEAILAYLADESDELPKQITSTDED